MGIDVRRSADRFVTQTGWLASRHSFSFGAHYDPSNMGFGLLVVSNDDVVAPGGGFGTHEHRDMEIVSWVLEGELVHEDSEGNTGVATPGVVQRMSAGTGIQHSERNGSSTAALHFVQMWIRPDQAGRAPAYEHMDITSALDRGGLVPVASGRPEHDEAVRIGQVDAVLHAGRLHAGEDVAVPAAAYAHLYVTRGSIELAEVGGLETGDAVRMTASDGRHTASTDSAAEILVWEMRSPLP